MATSETCEYTGLKRQDYCLEEAFKRCVEKYGERLNNPDHHNKSTCPPIWDSVLCWPETPIDTVASQLCPDYVVGFDKPNNATKQCMSNAQWFINTEITNETYWTNYSECYSNDLVTIIVELPSINASLIEKYMPVIKNISRTGYSVSLSTLIVAFCIMFCFKKLHCARNKLHMHLFASFIFRAAMFFLKDTLFIEGVGMASDIRMKDSESYFVQQLESNNWQCKMLTSFWQYFITANYSWILMEGLYLHNLILLALFSDSNSSIKYYIILGWGLPAIVIGIYVIVRITLEDDFCWTTYNHQASFLLIRIPTILSNLINFVLFINISRVLLLKLRSPVNEETKLLRRWARSTLVLVPLFGVHYAVFVGMSYYINVNETVELTWLFCDQLFASFQGFFVAVLFCFLNGEVKTELRPYFKNFVSLWLSAPLSVFFNCSEFSRSTKGRPSVCTTLSCSSLYTSTITQRYQNRRSKWDISQPNGLKSRHSIIQEKCPEGYHICELNGKCPENYCYCPNGITHTEKDHLATELTSCLSNCERSDLKPETIATTDLEMITVANQ